MANPIEPALTAEEWASLAASEFRAEWLKQTTDTLGHVGTIAALNHLLPGDDPRKITRAKIERMQQAEIRITGPNGDPEDDDEATADLRAFADALASYLRPDV